jgi:hypothetical protein
VTRYDDVQGRSLRLTDERLHHIQTAHPELADALRYLTPTLQHPDRIVRPRTDNTVELFYRYFETTPVTSKYLCVVAKTAVDDPFIITMVSTDAIMEKVDTEGHVIGFSILNISQTKDQAPLSVTLRDVAA